MANSVDAFKGAQDSDIFANRETVVVGNNTLGFNRAAGGLLESWDISGTEILNRGNSYRRGCRTSLEWADVDSETQRLVRHNPDASSSRYATGVEAQGAPLISISVVPHPSGGTIVTTESIPVEFDPDGELGVSGISSDHGGGVGQPILWKDMRCRQQYWFDWAGIAGMHFVATSWYVPEAIDSRYFDVALNRGLFLDTAFDEVLIYNAATDVTSDVTAAADAVDWRRFAETTGFAFQDNVAAPGGGPLLPQGTGGVMGRNSGTDLCVAVAGNVNSLNTTLDITLADYERGNEWAYATNRTGSTGHDGDQAGTAVPEQLDFRKVEPPGVDPANPPGMDNAEDVGPDRYTRQREESDVDSPSLLRSWWGRMVQGKSTSDRVWDLATKLAVPAVIALAGAVVVHEVRISVIESNRFTIRDGRELEERIKTMFPPQWLREDVLEIRNLVRSMEARLREVEKKVK